VPTIAKDYLMTPVQTTRGCPFDCEFCDVIHLFGRRSRHKPIERVLGEIEKIERMGVRRVFFSDDNFIGRPSYAKNLLRQLVSLNNSFPRPLSFSTQVTMNVARDEELLELLADANFFKLLIGIESVNPESLKETNKPQNYKTDLLADIHKIHSYGPENIAARMTGMIRQIKRSPRLKRTPLRVLLQEEGLKRVTGIYWLRKRHPQLGTAMRQSLHRTWRHAPFALQKIAGLWVNVLMRKEFTDSMGNGIEAIIDYEAQHPPQPLQDKAVTLTPLLRKDYKDMFPSIYRRLSSRLQDPAHLTEALMEVVSEFIERFHSEHDRLGAQRFTHAQEICDRTLARLNGEDPTTTNFPDAPPVESLTMMHEEEGRQILKDIRRRKLDDDILEAVELELRRAPIEVSFEHARRLQPELVSP
jgi:hypothetical protein